MGRKISFILDLEPNVQTSKIQVRVIRLWVVEERKSTDQFKSIEMLLLDAKVNIQLYYIYKGMQVWVYIYIFFFFPF